MVDEPRVGWDLIKELSNERFVARASLERTQTR
jgi:hypothetical protein